MITNVAQLFPVFLAEIKALLVREGRSDHSDQLARLPVIDRCHCGEENCPHFYTASKPDGSYGAGHEDLMLLTERGLVVLDLVSGSIDAETAAQEGVQRTPQAASRAPRSLWPSPLNTGTLGGRNGEPFARMNSSTRRDIPLEYAV